MGESVHSTDRRVVGWLAIVTAVVAVVVQIVEGPSGSGYGWGSVVISAVLVAVPLVAVGLMVLSGESRFAWAAVVIAVLMVAVGLLALVGNWSAQSTGERVMDLVVTLLVMATAGATAAVEVPLTRR